MKRIPHSREVDRALKSVKSEVQIAWRELNNAASRAMAKGDYTTAEALAAKGKGIHAFLVDVESFRKRWRTLRVGGEPRTNNTVTPLWAYYQPILKALAQVGGESHRKDLEPSVFQLLNSQMLPRDRELLAGGRERWQVMVGRARKDLVVEGWLEDRKGTGWVITEAGRSAATARVVKAR